MRQFLDVMNKAEELPLRIDLLLAAQREPIQPLVVSDVAEHRFHGGETPAIQHASALRIDGLLHEVRVARLAVRRFFTEEADLPGLCRFRLSQTLITLRTGQAIP